MRQCAAAGSTAIGNERIRAVTASAVVFSVRADDHGGKKKMHLPGAEFVRRVLPTGIKRVRHYGVLAATPARPACAMRRMGDAGGGRPAHNGQRRARLRAEHSR